MYRISALNTQVLFNKYYHLTKNSAYLTDPAIISASTELNDSSSADKRTTEPLSVPGAYSTTTAAANNSRSWTVAPKLFVTNTTSSSTCCGSSKQISSLPLSVSPNSNMNESEQQIPFTTASALRTSLSDSNSNNNDNYYISNNSELSSSFKNNNWSQNRPKPQPIGTRPVSMVHNNSNNRYRPVSTNRYVLVAKTPSSLFGPKAVSYTFDALANYKNIWKQDNSAFMSPYISYAEDNLNELANFQPVAMTAAHSLKSSNELDLSKHTKLSQAQVSTNSRSNRNSYNYGVSEFNGDSRPRRYSVAPLSLLNIKKFNTIIQQSERCVGHYGNNNFSTKSPSPILESLQNKSTVSSTPLNTNAKAFVFTENARTSTNGSRHLHRQHSASNGIPIIVNNNELSCHSSPSTRTAFSNNTGKYLSWQMSNYYELQQQQQQQNASCGGDSSLSSSYGSSSYSNVQGSSGGQQQFRPQRTVYCYDNSSSSTPNYRVYSNPSIYHYKRN